jgi:NADPH:quinone reductase-like Zn-dependent oxidoreductase
MMQGREAKMESAMKAMVYHECGTPHNLELQEVETPIPKVDQVLIKVRAASVNALDWHFLTGKPFMARIMAGGLIKPKQTILGVDLAGRVEAVGARVTRFQPGDKVFGGCGSGGAFAEYACAGDTHIQPKPANMAFNEAAAHTALQVLRGEGDL